jgi:hypothetical protein
MYILPYAHKKCKRTWFQAANPRSGHGRAAPAAHALLTGAVPSIPTISGDNMTALKVKDFPGLTRVAPQTIESHSLEQALRDETFAYEMLLHDLRSEFIAREQKLRESYLAKMNAITSGD